MKWCRASREEGLALGDSVPFPPFMWSWEHQELQSRRPPHSRDYKKGHNSNPSYKSTLFLRNTEEQKGRDKERRRQGTCPSGRSPHSPPRKGLPAGGSQTTCRKVLSEPRHRSWQGTHPMTCENTPHPWGENGEVRPGALKDLWFNSNMIENY